MSTRVEQDRVDYLLDFAVRYKHGLEELVLNALSSSTKSLSATYIEEFYTHISAGHSGPFEDCTCAAKDVVELTDEELGTNV